MAIRNPPQRGRSNRARDKLFEAQPPGMRVGPAGIYWETRRNRSDRNRENRL